MLSRNGFFVIENQPPGNAKKSRNSAKQPPPRRFFPTPFDLGANIPLRTNGVFASAHVERLFRRVEGTFFAPALRATETQNKYLPFGLSLSKPLI
jgi:hypothetical protein